MKIDEPFKPEIKGEDPPAGLDFRIATISDCDPIFKLMCLRNPHADHHEIFIKTKKEIEVWCDGKSYGLFVCSINNEILGFCRFYHSDNLPLEKKLFPAPSGYYAMGTMVDPMWRRRGIARFLSDNRKNWLKKIGAESNYSIVSVDNLTSLRMHLNFGYEEVARATGFLNVSFEPGEGILLKLKF